MKILLRNNPDYKPHDSIPACSLIRRFRFSPQVSDSQQGTLVTRRSPPQHLGATGDVTDIQILYVTVKGQLNISSIKIQFQHVLVKQAWLFFPYTFNTLPPQSQILPIFISRVTGKLNVRKMHLLFNTWDKMSDRNNRSNYNWI